MFDSLLIANRGEIACRVIATARRLGLRTVAVFSDADRAALHVELADEAIRLGPAPAAESYLNREAILEALAASGAEAVHPGYGFLAENPDFAEAVAAAGAVFVGPPPTAMRATGSKSEARALMQRTGVPVVPGYHGAERTPERLAAEAERLGFPVLIKAVAGGGGKGMRVVARAKDFAAALAAARREARAAFGDDRVLIERYLERPCHVEVQVFADAAGDCIHLFERDCSLQRRYQKVIEEAPAPGLDEARRAEMGRAAVAAAEAAGYVGAGTVEFLVEDEAFYFMEMNARLQVEHPVTEMVTGEDLVEWQLRVAAGEPLPRRQDELALRGHAIEARLYAEDPARGFLPAGGRLARLRLPAEAPDLRVDAGVREGDTVGLHYDPLLAKLIVWGRDRATARRRLVRALERCQVAGPASNLAFLAAVAGHPAFAAGAVDTGFVERCRGELLPEAGPVGDEVLALAVLAELERRRRAAAATAAASGDPHSPWHDASGWRPNAEPASRVRLLDGEREVTVVARGPREGLRVDLPGGAVSARGALADDGTLAAEIDGRRVTAAVVFEGPDIAVLRGPHVHRLRRRDPLDVAAEEAMVQGALTAPLHGRVAQVAAGPGVEVRRGATLVVLEAMKMEHSIRAPADGRVATVRYAEGEWVEEGAELLVFEPAEE